MRTEPTPQEIESSRIYRQFGLTEDEYARVLELLGRLPNYVEIGLFSVMWSEHCSYKSSKKVLRRFPTEGPQVLQGPGENAGAVDIGDGWAAVFKIESHNHPTAIEPYQGAATGVGGIIRDIFTMGARPVALLNSLRFGPLADARNRYLFGHAVAGIGGYGNCIGIPTVGGEVVFDEHYTHNPLVNAMCVGVILQEQLVKGAASGVGNPVLVVGAKTGRDGIHGATFASAQDPHAKERSAVQVGDPFMEKLLMEACLELIATGKVVGIQDMGAAGLTSSAAEMAGRAGSGLEIDVSAVPRRETGMTPYEVMLSESQERMLVVMASGEEQTAASVFSKWGLEATVIGRVTDDGRLRVLEGQTVAADVPIEALVDEAPVLDRPALAPAYLQALRTEALEQPEPADYGAALAELLSRPTIASKRWVYEQYDATVRTETRMGPGSDAAVIGVPGTDKALALATDGNGRRVYLDPFAGGALAVAEAARNTVCAGAIPLAVTDCLNFGNPEKPEVFYQFEQAAAGMSAACEALGTPVVSGNVSLYNESHGVDIYPTPVVGVVGLIERAEYVTPSAFQLEGSEVFALGELRELAAAGIAGSEYLAMVAPDDALAYRIPAFDLERERALQAACMRLIRAGLVEAAHDVSDGGLLTAAAEAAIMGGRGLSLRFDGVVAADPHQRQGLFFGENGSCIVLEIRSEHASQAEAAAAAEGVPLTRIGRVTGDGALRVTVGDREWLAAAVPNLAAVWREAIGQWMS